MGTPKQDLIEIVRGMEFKGLRGADPIKVADDVISIIEKNYDKEGRERGSRGQIVLFMKASGNDEVKSKFTHSCPFEIDGFENTFLAQAMRKVLVMNGKQLQIDNSRPRRVTYSVINK